MSNLENLVRRDIKKRERRCRMCGREIDFANDAGVMRDIRHINYDDGKRRLEMYAYCDNGCKIAFESWERNPESMGR